MRKYTSLLCLFLVCSLFLSCVQPARAASVTGTVEPSGVYDLVADYSSFTPLPDRVRGSWSYTPGGLYYWAKADENNVTYDSNTLSLKVGYEFGNLTLYPSGNSFLKIPDGIYASDVSISVSFTVWGSASAYYKPYLYVYYYDADFSLVGSAYTYQSCKPSSSGTSDFTLTCPCTIPDEAVYFMPVLTGNGYVYSSSYYFVVYPDSMSVSFAGDIAPAVNGIWTANDAISGSNDLSEAIDFSVGDVLYCGMEYQITGSLSCLSYLLENSRETVYVDQWYGDSKKIIDLGYDLQFVGASWYSWFVSNFTRIGESSTEISPTSLLKIYDYGRGTLIDSVSVPTPNIIFATATGFQIQDYSTAEVLYTYTYDGEDSFAGFSLSRQDYVDYEVGTNFVNLSDGVTLYVYGEDDLSGGDSGGDDGNSGDDSGNSGVTDPSDPSDSGSTEPTEDPLDKEKDEADKQGNDSIDQILDVIPNVSDDIVSAYDGLIAALKYEGTTAKLMTPAIVIPELPGSVPKIVLLEPQEIDFEYWFNQIPVGLMIVVRALFTGALILYCAYEAYGLFEYFVSLKGSNAKRSGG